MLLLQSAAAIAHAAETHPDAALRALLASRIAQLAPSGIDIAQQVNFFIVEPGDTLDDVAACLGFSPLENLVDGTRFPDPDFVPSWEWAEYHPGSWLELVFILSEDGPAEVLLVPPSDTTDPIANAARAFISSD